ncbi:juvenile hormone acid O-methyltransferase [Solenopsis invicta]|uniref:juvenile hormone acid O-methyltransferase n=1 Tax=Solenopsis invicta TaxID=13686 RepID=UPI000595B756|nr:juvenile hormone acid O-methyltransferase [Solenopsis invicta]XP_025988917.1 juvenile hormone acid O-methyltransferase [Solenopsis invicta]
MNPAKHTSLNEVQKDNVRNIINLFGEELKNICGKCMDVGCGPGDITTSILLPSLDPKAVIIGTDISTAMVKYAQKTYGDNERLEFEILDIEIESLPEKYLSKFDHIFSFHTLHWCNDARRIFQNMYCMLQPGGTILVFFGVSHATIDVIKKMTQDIRFAPYLQRKFGFPFSDSARPCEELTVLLESIGFNIKHCEIQAQDFSNINTNAFLSSIFAMFTFLDAMPPIEKKEFMDDFVREYHNKVNHGNEQHNKAETIDLHYYFIVYAQKTK